MQQVSPEIALVVEAECVRAHEGRMSIAATARRCRSTGVEDCITFERPASEPRRPDRVRRKGHRRGRGARENRSAASSRGRESDRPILRVRQRVDREG